MTNLIRKEMDNIYRNIASDNIPWNIETPPKELVELSVNGLVNPCKTIDLGCGVGNYSTFFSNLGFDVTGVDISPSAIKLAKEKTSKKKLDAQFFVADLLGDLNEFEAQTYDFAYDWEVLHHITPKNRKKYVENIYKLLNPGATYLSVCFSEIDPHFGGKRKYRETQLGTILYFSSEKELKELFEAHFSIKELKTIEIRGKFKPHIANYVLMKRK